jgi:hypothetical protein
LIAHRPKRLFGIFSAEILNWHHGKIIFKRALCSINLFNLT